MIDLTQAFLAPVFGSWVLIPLPILGKLMENFEGAEFIEVGVKFVLFLVVFLLKKRSGH